MRVAKQQDEEGRRLVRRRLEFVLGVGGVRVGKQANASRQVRGVHFQRSFGLTAFNVCPDKLESILRWCFFFPGRTAAVGSRQVLGHRYLLAHLPAYLHWKERL